MTLARVVTGELGGSRLARAIISGTVPTGWLPSTPRSAEEWRARLGALQGDGALARRFEELTPSFGAGGAPGANTAAARRLDASRGARGAVVTTGQQPGLFGGPVYTWSKALSALALADALQDATGVPVAPVFWAATDDADFEEARSTLIAPGAGVERLTLPDTTERGLPMASVPLGDVNGLIDRLAAAAGSVAHPQALRAVRDAYGEGEVTVGGAYVALLRAVLEPLGIAVLDASHETVREQMRPVMLLALERAVGVEHALDARTAAIRAAGFEPQVPTVPGLTLVSRTGPGGRQRVRHSDAKSASHDAGSGLLGPNVLLRPVAERTILPTAAYLAGPGELAYFAQVGVVADALDLPAPLALPRWSCTIIEPHIARILERRGVAANELAHETAPEMRLARAAMPVPVEAALTELRQALETSMTELAAATERGDGHVVDPRVVSGARVALLHRVERLERRLVAAVARRSDDVRRDLATARAALRPDGKPQERALNFIPFLARQGPELLGRMLQAASQHARALVTPTTPPTPGGEPTREAGGRSGGHG